MPRKAKNDCESVLARLMASCIPVTETGCWLWTGEWVRHGYGRISIGRHRYIASRMSWALLRGEIPAGMLVCHKCDTPPCINPDHLFLGNTSDNAIDMVRKGRGNNFRGEEVPRSKLTEAEVRSIFLDERFMSEIAADFGVNRTCVLAIKHRRTWAHITAEITQPAPIKEASSAIGEQCGSAKLSTADALQIRVLFDAGNKQKEIAARFGVSQSLVSLIGLRKSWTHLLETA